MTPLPPDPSPAAVAQSERHFQTLIEQAADGIFMSDAQGRIVLANTRMCEMLGYGRDEIIGLDVLETYMPEDRDQGRARMAHMPAGETLRFERTARRKDGTSIPVDVSVAWLPDGERQSIMRDVSRRKVGEEARRLDDRRLRALVRLSEFESHSLKEMLDVALEEVVQLSDSVFGYIYFYDDQTQLFALHSWSKEVMAACTVADRTGIYELDETGIWGEAVRQREPIVVNDFAAPHPLKRGYPEGHAGLTSFMTIPVVSRGRIVAVVGVANKATDYTDADVSQLTQMMDVVWKVAERQQAEDELRQLAQALECRVEERTREFEAANAELEAANAELQQMLVDEEVLQAELAYRALHDPLTGLANRTLFGQRLDYAFQVSGRGVAVLWIDLDHFKEVNDIFGHDTGDELLVAVADRLREMVRDTDDIARMGGDEFAIVLPNVAPNEAQMVAERILATITHPSAFRLQISASIGVGWQAAHKADDHRALIKLADEAMYRAKAAGGGRALA